MKRHMVIISFLLLLVFACTKQNSEQLTLEAHIQEYCDLDTARFNEHVMTIINANCMPCHNNDRAEGGITLVTWEDVSFLAQEGTLLDAIKQNGFAIAMPQDAPKLNDCYIHAIELWTNQGTLNN